METPGQGLRAQSSLSPADELALVVAWRERRDEAARDRLVASHYRLCLSVARRFDRNPAHVHDLAQEGVIGLMQASERFDPSFGVRFAAYARHYVHNAIAKRLAAVNLVVDVPARAYRRARRDSEADPPTWRAAAASKGELPLDAPASPDGEAALVDTIEDARPTPEEAVSEAQRLTRISEAVSRALEKAMTPREASVIRRRALAEQGETLDAIARDLGVSRERVRQIEEQAQSKLKRYLVNAGFQRSLLRQPD